MSLKEWGIRLSPIALLIGLVALTVFLRIRPEPSQDLRDPTPEGRARKDDDSASTPSLPAVAKERGRPIRVVNASQVPVVGATVFGAVPDHDREVVAHTDAEGLFTLPVTEDYGARRYVIHSEGYVPKVWYQRSIPETYVPEIVLVRSPSVEGMLLEEGTWKGIEGARIEGSERWEDPHVPLWSTITDPDGRFRVSSILRGGIALRVVGGWVLEHRAIVAGGDDMAPSRDPRIPESVARAYKGMILMAARRAGNVEVLVKDEADVPVSGALVDWGVKLRTDEEGRAVIRDMYPRKTRFIVDAEGYPPVEKEVEPLSGKTLTVVVELEKGKARIYGKIHTSPGQPVPVRIDAGKAEPLSYMPYVSARVSPEGNYELWVPHETPFRLRVFFTETGKRNGPIPWIDTNIVRLGFNQSLKRDLTLPPLGTLTVKVTNKKGRGLRDANVEVRGEPSVSEEVFGRSEGLYPRDQLAFISYEVYNSYNRQVTDDRGEVRFFLPPGNWTLSAKKAGYYLPKPLTVESRGKEDSATLVLSDGLTLMGVVLAHDGQPAQGYQVRLTSSAWLSVTDTQGRFHYSEVPEGLHSLWVLPPGTPNVGFGVYRTEVSCGPGMEPLTIQLPYVQRIRAQVSELPATEPDQVALQFYGPRGDSTPLRLRATPMPDGLYGTDYAPPGQYSYALEVRWNRPRRRYEAARGVVTVVSGQDAMVVIDPQAPASFTLKLQVPETAPYQSYSAQLESLTDEKHAGSSVKPGAGFSGEADIDILAAVGRYELTVTGVTEKKNERTRRVKTVLWKETVTLDESGLILRRKIR